MFRICSVNAKNVQNFQSMCRPCSEYPRHKLVCSEFLDFAVYWKSLQFHRQSQTTEHANSFTENHNNLLNTTAMPPTIIINYYRPLIALVYNTHQTQANEKLKQNERKTSELFTRTIRQTHHTGNERTIYARANYWNVTIYHPMTNYPGSIEIQYSIVLLFEWLLCKLTWLTNLIFHTQLIYIYKW